MSAIARYLNSMSKSVSGYDIVRSDLCIQLEKECIKICYKDNTDDLVFENFNTENTLVIYTPAIPSTSKILQYFKKNKFILLKRSQVLGIITKQSFNISVAGTHGKTTTSTLISHLLNYAQMPFAAFLGGISVNLKSNYYNTNTGTKTPFTVTEADEYDRSFLTLSPDIAVITSMDADHLDIYGSVEELRKTFRDFIEKIKQDGTLIFNNNLEVKKSKNINFETYGLEKGNYYASNIRIENCRFRFDFNYKDQKWENITLGIPGIHNVENAVSAMAVCIKLGIKKEEIIKGLEDFKGVKRRFEYIINNPNKVFIDDYAHHPSEIESLINSVKLLYKNKKITGIFQPHLFSRTRDFANGFAKSLSLLDTCILLDIYPARELPIEGITSKMLYDKITSPEKYLCNKENLVDLIKELSPNLMLTIGAGDIDTLISPLKKLLNNEQ